MRVIIVADFADSSGGAPAVAVQSALGLADLDVPTTFVHAVGTRVDERLADAGVGRIGLGLDDVWSLSGPEAAMRGIWNRRAARRLGSALAEVADGDAILHLHQWTRAFSPAIFPVLLATGLPLVVTLHDYFLSCPTGLYYRFDRHEPCALVPLSTRCIVAPCDPHSMAHKAVRVLRSAATRAAVSGRRFDVVHVSDRGRDTIAPFLPPQIGQHRVDNPIDVGPMPPVEIGPETRIAYVGRLTREKGADLVAEASAAAGMPALFIGEGPSEAEIRRLAPHAELTGWRPRAEVEHLLRTGVRAILAPSLWYETGPLSVLEGLAAGLPAIVSDRAGAAERVVDGETGFVVPPDMGSLADAIRQVSDLGLARRLGRTAHERYWARPPTRQAHAARLVEVYSGLLARRRTAA